MHVVFVRYLYQPVIVRVNTASKYEMVTCSKNEIYL